MRKNRKMPKKMSVMAGRSVQFGAVIVMVVAMAILNVLASSSCRQLAKVVREKERQLEKLEDAQKRESARWDEMKTSRIQARFRLRALRSETWRRSRQSTLQPRIRSSV